MCCSRPKDRVQGLGRVGCFVPIGYKAAEIPFLPPLSSTDGSICIWETSSTFRGSTQAAMFIVSFWTTWSTVSYLYLWKATFKSDQFKSFWEVWARSFYFFYRPMKKCVRPVRNAPTAMRKQPTAMSLGRCSLAPKWLTTARNNKFPFPKKDKAKQQKEWRELSKAGEPMKFLLVELIEGSYPFQNFHRWVQRVCWRGRSVSRSEWWSFSCRLQSEPWRTRRRTAPRWTTWKYKKKDHVSH